jgi:hypothetical protein
MASEKMNGKGVSLLCSDIPLNLGHLFADCFEPEAIYQVRIGGNYPKGSLLNSCETGLSTIGVAPEAPELLMEVSELEWSMDEFLEKAGAFAPTLMLVKMKNGTECGGVAGVPWPGKRLIAADPAKGSFIFSLGATPARFDLVRPESALCCDWKLFGFGCSVDKVRLMDDGSIVCSYTHNDLYIRNNGWGCGSLSSGDYDARGRRDGQLIGATATEGYYCQPYERWELWRL